MITTVALIDRLNDFKGWSDYRVSQMLEISYQAIQKYRKRGTVMGDETALKAAEILGLPPEFVIANIHAERAINSPAFDTLKRIAEMVENEEKEAIKAAEAKHKKAA